PRCVAAAAPGRRSAPEAGAARQEPAEEKPVAFAKGSFIIRLDQPYSRLADTMLDVQYVRSTEQVYDDTGWTLGYLKNLEFKRVANPEVLKVAMHAWDGAMPAAPATNNAATSFSRSWGPDASRTRP